jgi:hypothetical protein
MQDASANVYGSMACHLLRHSILMRIWRLAAAVGVVMLVGSLSAEDARSVIAEASRAMGVVGVNSVTLAGTAVYGNFGQSQRLSFGLAFTTIGNYNRTFDFARGISHSIGVAAPPGAPNGVPPGPFDDLITPASPGIKQLEIWTTPWGFLLGAAAASNLTLKTQTVDKVRYRVVSYSTPFRASSGRPYTIAGYISPQGIVDKVETWIDHPLMGDLEVMFNYGNYQDAAGVKVPTKVSQKNIGMEVYVARFAFAAANPPDLEKLLQATVPDVAAAPVPMLSKPLAAGVYLITGGYDALVVELKDSVVILGGGGNEARGLALIAEARRLVPGKPIAYAVNMHGHFDHAMVLPAFASAGITILTDDPNQYFLQESLNTPRTLVCEVEAARQGRERHRETGPRRSHPQHRTASPETGTPRRRYASRMAAQRADPVRVRYRAADRRPAVDAVAGRPGAEPRSPRPRIRDLHLERSAIDAAIEPIGVHGAAVASSSRRRKMTCRSDSSLPR